MDSSPNLTLPYIIAAQAQKHVTHNEAIRGLDALVQLMALDKDLASPPGSPADGDRYIVGPSPTGAWSGQAGKVAAYVDGAWAFYTPREGWRAWVADEDKLYIWDGSTWAVFASGGGGGGATVWGIDCSLTAGVASSALTITLLDKDGNAPSGGSPVSIPFAATTGAPVVRSLTSSLTLVVSSGSTLGATNGSAFRLWVVVFDDGGTLRLGVVNCSTPAQIYPLTETPASSIAEGGAGAADSAGVIYTGTAATSKPYRILGYMDWPSGLTAAGTWDAAPTTLKLFTPGDKRPGDLLQRVYAEYTANADLAVNIPSDDTVPQNTEGTQILTATLGAVDELAHVAIRWFGSGSISGAGGNIAAALFRDSGANAVASSEGETVDSAGYRRAVNLQFQERPGAGTFTYNLRVGTQAGLTLRLNGHTGGRTHGGAQRSAMTIEAFQG